MPNQYTKAKAAGAQPPKGANQFTTGKRTSRDEASIDKARAERAAQVAEQIMNDEASTKDQRLAAAKVLLPYGKSSLQSIESRTVEEPRSEAEIMAQLHTLLADPASRAQIQAMLAAGNPDAAQQCSAATPTDDPQVGVMPDKPRIH